MRSKAIGVDSDSLGAVCVLVDTSVSRVVVQEYDITDEALGRFVRWVGQNPDAVVTLEGHHGHSKPFESALRRAGLPFHSFSAFEVSRFRSAVLGQNKNNQRDAEAVARYALALEGRSRLDLPRRSLVPGHPLQPTPGRRSAPLCGEAVQGSPDRPEPGQGSQGVVLGHEGSLAAQGSRRYEPVSGIRVHVQGVRAERQLRRE